MEAQFTDEQIFQWFVTVARAIAHEGEQLCLQCSERTFTERLDQTMMSTGPWTWDIKPSVPYGDVYLYRAKVEDAQRGERGARFGTFSIPARTIIVPDHFQLHQVLGEPRRAQ